MALDLERIMILMQRRYNSFREISKLTDELQEALTRNDEVAAAMLLQMRGEEMAAADTSTEQIWVIAEHNKDHAEIIKRLMYGEASGDGEVLRPEEKKIFEIRQNTKQLIKRIQEIDRQMNQRVSGEKSYYVKAKK